MRIVRGPWIPALLLLALLPALTAGRRRSPALSLALTTPAPHQVFQRDGAGLASVPVAGACSGSAGAVEARLGAGAWLPVDPTPNCDGDGAFAGVLADQPVGQGELRVRFAGFNAVQDAVAPVGVGDLLVIAGQSNAVMDGDSLHAFAHPARSASAFTFTRSWKIGHDTIHHDAGSSYQRGSSWPLLATLLMGNTNAPVAFVGTALGATGLVTPPDWRPWSPDGLGLYARMLTSVDLATAGTRDVRAVLWLQGESEAGLGVPYDDYRAALLDLADHLAVDLPGVPLVAGQIGDNWFADPENLEEIRDAQVDAALQHPTILAGPFTADLPVFIVHFRSDDALRALAERWCESLSGTVYPVLDCALSSFEP